jgi:signal transduction histidine kinase
MNRSDRSRMPTIWLQLLLVGGLASIVLILAQTYRASSSSHAVVERAMRDYAGFAAWSYREHLVTRLRDAIDEVLGAVNHGDGLHTSGRVPHARELGHYLRWDPECKCHRPRRGPRPERFLGFTVGSDTLGIGTNLAPAGTQGWIVDPPMTSMMHTVPAMVYSLHDVAWINALLTGLARERARPNWGYHVVVVRRNSTTNAFATRSMPTEWGDTVVYAVEYAPSSIDSLLRGVLASGDLLPPSLVADRPIEDVLNLEVSDASGEPLYRSHQSVDWELDATSQLPASYGGLRIRAQLRPELAEAMLIGGVPNSRVPLLLVLLALALGLTALAAVQLRREVRFATERTNFVANVSHELRTPLTQVRLVLDTLRLGRGGDAHARDAALGVADREVLRLQHLVDGLLRFTRGSKPNEAPRVRTDVVAEARAVASEFLPLAAPRGVSLEVVSHEAVHADLQNGALRQLLLNLLDNAVKYGDENSRVTIDIGARDRGGAQIAVTNSGIGVPQGDRERIWRPFERGTLAKTRAVGGSGIGLTIVRDIAEEHGGRAWVEDAPGGGARFVIELPAENSV